MGNGVNGKIRLTLESVTSESIYWHKRRDRKIIITGGLEKESVLLSSMIKENNPEIPVYVKGKEYKREPGDYVINLEEIELVY